ncbi:hypothetical protein [Tunturiibacter psychrotolerans]|uniref:hypothetical protein n=1 Tax=Tunturiibacter psychrotolerans TaxID=3069686 RepID=UPI003D1BE44A
MKAAIVILLIVAFYGLPTQSQTTTTGRATSSGTCGVTSHSGNNDTINVFIKNCGVGKEQGDKIIALLQEVLAGHDLDTVNSKLDQLLKIAREGQTRRLSTEQIESIKNYLAKTPSTNFAGISFSSSDRDSTIYAGDFKDVFKEKNWPIDGPVWIGQVSPQFGVFVDVNGEDKDSPPKGAMDMITMLNSLGIPCKGQVSPLVSKGYYTVEIGLKPVNP